jgi:hypothetical protein
VAIGGHTGDSGFLAYHAAVVSTSVRTNHMLAALFVWCFCNLPPIFILPSLQLLGQKHGEGKLYLSYDEQEVPAPYFDGCWWRGYPKGYGLLSSHPPGFTSMGLLLALYSCVILCRKSHLKCVLFTVSIDMPVITVCFLL